MKRILRIFLIVFIAILTFGVGFILTLQAFEYHPAEITPLEISSNDGELVTLGETIKIVTFNIGYASLSATEDFVMDGGKKARMDSLAEVEANLEGIGELLTDADADIYLIQEVDEDSSRSYRTNQYSYLQSTIPFSATLGYNFRVLFVPFPLNLSQMMGNVNSGIASLIRYRVEAASRIQLPGEFSWPLRLANLKRCIVVSRLDIAGSDKQLVVINVHLSAYDDGQMRLLEMAKLQEIMAAEQALGNYIVVGGDFNQTFPGAYTNTDVDAFGQPLVEYLYPLRNAAYWEAFGMDGEWFETNGFQYGVEAGFPTPTCRLLHQPYDSDTEANNQYYYIDGFLVSANVSIQSIHVIDQAFVYSDHNPVAMEIVLNP
jgi:endonuclease/exonuclease/phosphatase family metal-dependent hydrolase